MVHRPEIAETQPSIADRRCRLGRRVVVARHHLMAANEDLAGRPERDRGSGLRVGDLDLDVVKRNADGFRDVLGRVVRSGHAHRAVAFRLAERDEHPRVELLLDPHDQLPGHGRPAGQDRPQAREIVPAEVRMVQDRDQHRGHRQRQRPALCLGQLEEQTGVESRHHHMRTGTRQGSHRRQARPADVEQRHRIDPGQGRVVVEPGAARREVVRRRDPPVGQHRALRDPRGTGCVLDLSDGVRRHLGQCSRGVHGTVRARQQFVQPARHLHGRNARDRLLGDGLQITAAMLLGEVQATCLGLAKDVSQLCVPVCRIDSHEDQAGESRPDLEQDPVGAVRRPQRDPITGLKLF